MRTFLFSMLFCVALHAQEAPAPTVEQLQAQLAEEHQENVRITKLLQWYQQQFFILQGQMIEQQVAPKQVARPMPKPDAKEAPKN
jgi:hypothetical protein